LLFVWKQLNYKKENSTMSLTNEVSIELERWNCSYSLLSPCALSLDPKLNALEISLVDPSASAKWNQLGSKLEVENWKIGAQHV
jgi:hypothetical protein